MKASPVFQAVELPLPIVATQDTGICGVGIELIEVYDACTNYIRFMQDKRIDTLNRIRADSLRFYRRWRLILKFVWSDYTEFLSTLKKDPCSIYSRTAEEFCLTPFYELQEKVKERINHPEYVAEHMRLTHGMYACLRDLLPGGRLHESGSADGLVYALPE